MMFKHPFILPITELREGVRLKVGPKNDKVKTVSQQDQRLIVTTNKDRLECSPGDRAYLINDEIGLYFIMPPDRLFFVNDDEGGVWNLIHFTTVQEASDYIFECDREDREDLCLNTFVTGCRALMGYWFHPEKSKPMVFSARIAEKDPRKGIYLNGLFWLPFGCIQPFRVEPPVSIILINAAALSDELVNNLSEISTICES